MSGIPREPLHQRVDLGLRRDAAVGFAGEFRMISRVFGGEQRQRLLRREGEAILLADRDRHRPCARVLDHRAVDREAGIGIEDVGAGLAEHQDRGEHRHLAAGHDDHLVGRYLDADAAVDVGGHRLAQHLDAGRRRVAVMAVAERLHRRLDDVLGRAEIRLADAEVDDVATLAGELGGAGQHGKGVLSPIRSKPADGMEHGGFPDCRSGFDFAA